MTDPLPLGVGEPGAVSNLVRRWWICTTVDPAGKEHTLNVVAGSATDAWKDGQRMKQPSHSIVDVKEWN